MPTQRFVKRLLVIYHEFFYSPTQMELLQQKLREMGIDSVFLYTAGGSTEHDIRLFDLDGLPEPEFGQIRQMVADALKSTHGSPRE